MASSKWLTLPPFIPTLVNVKNGNQISSPSTITALKWVTRCCPQIPKTLVHKLFRLRQVRTQPPNHTSFKRLSPKDTLNSGDLIFLPQSVKQTPPPTHKHKHLSHSHPPLTDKQINFIRTLLIYKDPALLVLNKPPGLPVQGGINIKHSLDVLAAASLNYDYSEPPRLVHRLDRDCSGILVMARTHTSATILHSIFRDKTSTASHNVVVDNGKSDRITVVDKSTSVSSQHAVTEYKVIGSSSNGYTWLELSPLTGRKHQLRVHCAEVLGTPIVGDYKYGWQAHKKWGLFEDEEDSSEELLKEETETLLPFGLNMKKGSICEKRPRLHLHCKQIVLPNICESLQNVESGSSRSCDLLGVESLELVAALPPYMQRSWEFTNS
ncbi:hypothetical protein TanjilG_15398 [Lupinus angustifolius]|uniref:Pseudouridine synthase RsuA/RluA-like domain-containing protein n=1 Tax=Lupinus angustifolius TaxID=3871 RepID=A0A1J7I8Q7_LUPAN|nr:hypothetical protein TanjilG_22992 [Lupinus angustifolius]OIW12949.1 hypothetical protein TanjilG_15398 [Lupinus angustifolius]